LILIVVKFPVRPERAEEWSALAADYARAVDAEEGSLFFEWSRSLEEPDTYVCVEGFRDAAAGGSHVGTDAFKRFVDVAPRSRRSSTSTPPTSPAGARWARSSRADAGRGHLRTA
jgi:quinol monooxygenase YgiN